MTRPGGEKTLVLNSTEQESKTAHKCLTNQNLMNFLAKIIILKPVIHPAHKLLANLSRGLTSELKEYPWIRRLLSSVRPHFQTFSTLKPLGQSKPNFM